MLKERFHFFSYVKKRKIIWTWVNIRSQVMIDTLNTKRTHEAVLTKLRNDRDSKSLVKNGEMFVEKLE